MSDRIELTGIRVLARHGVLPQEKDRPQPFLVDVVLYVPLGDAGGTDRIEDTIDYGGVAAAVRDLVADGSHSLIERVASEVAELLLGLPRVERVVVTVHKPEAPVEVPLQDVSVTVDRSR